MTYLIKFGMIVLLIVIGSATVFGYSRLDYSNPQDSWVDLVLSLNQSGNNFIVDNITAGGTINADNINVEGNITATYFNGYFIGNGSLWSGDSGNIYPTNWDRPGFNTVQLGLGTNDPQVVLDIQDFQPTVTITGTGATQTSMFQMGDSIVTANFMLVVYPTSWSAASLRNDLHLFNIGDIDMLSAFGNFKFDAYGNQLYKFGENDSGDSAIRIYNDSAKYIELGYDGDGYIDTNAGDLNIDSQTGHVGFGTQTNPQGVEFGLTFSNEDELGRDNVRIGWYGGTSRVIWEDSGYTMWEVDNSAGELRFYQPGKVFARLSNTSFSLGQNIEFIGRQNWTDNQNYPVACPAGTYITQLGDAITCTAITAEDVDPGTFPTGNYTFQNNLTILENLGVSGLIRGGFIDRYEAGNFNGSLYTNNAESQRSSNAANSLFQVISDTRGTPQFMIQNGGPSQASFIARSFLVVNQNNTLLNNSQNNICSDWGFNHIDCNTATTGADMGVMGDMEVQELIYSLQGYKGHAGDMGTFLELRDHVSPVAVGSNASYNISTKFFCDFVADNFDTSKGWIRLGGEDTTYEGGSADINSYINSSCITLKFNPSWTDLSGVDWKQLASPELIVNTGGFLEYYVGDDEQSQFKIKIKNGTGFTGVYIDDKVGADQHQALTIDMSMGNYEGQVAQNIYMSAYEEIRDKRMTGILMEADATNLNSSDGTFIDMTLIGTPLVPGHFDGISMPPGITHLIDVGSADSVSAVYDNEVNITGNVTGVGTAEVFTLDNDILYVGAEVNFTTIGIALDSEGSVNALFLYWYCNQSGEYQILTGVTDTTNGFTASGGIHLTTPENRGVCNTELDGTPFIDANNYTYIGIQRTRNTIVTKPVLDIVSISGASTNMFLSDTVLRLNPSTGPGDCDATNLGAIYFDSDWDDICVCKSTGSWTIVGSGNVC